MDRSTGCRHFAGALLALGCAAWQGQAGADEDFHARVASVYGFEQGSLRGEAMRDKSRQMDEFWSLVKADKGRYLPMLRQELENPANPSFFFYDGAVLLSGISEDRKDWQLALQSMSHVSLNGIVRPDYLMRIHDFASQGFDTRDAAFNILRDPQFKAVIAQHAMTLGQDYALICMLFPMEESRFVPDLVARLPAQTDETAIKSVLLALWYTVTPEGTAAIEAHAGSPNASAATIDYAKALLGRRAEVRQREKRSMFAPSLQTLRERRRAVMRRPISDEALSEFDQLTAQILLAD